VQHHSMTIGVDVDVNISRGCDNLSCLLAHHECQGERAAAWTLCVCRSDSAHQDFANCLLSKTFADCLKRLGHPCFHPLVNQYSSCWTYLIFLVWKACGYILTIS
jgi:hypothetical protein